jgi:hypothetical protein
VDGAKNLDGAKSLSNELRFFEPGNAGELAADIETPYRDRARRVESAQRAGRWNGSVRRRNEFMTRYFLATIGGQRLIPNREQLHNLADPPLFDGILESQLAAHPRTPDGHKRILQAQISQT